MKCLHAEDGVEALALNGQSPTDVCLKSGDYVAHAGVSGSQHSLFGSDPQIHGRDFDLISRCKKYRRLPSATAEIQNPVSGL